MNSSSTTVPWPRTTNSTVTGCIEHNYTAAVILGLVVLVLTFENYLLLFAVSVNKLKRVPEILIFWLALSAMLNSLISISIVAYHRAFDNTGKTGIDALCKTQFWFATTLRTNDIFTTTFMSLDRFIAITKPFLYRSRVRPEHGWISVASSFVISGIISCLPFLGFGRISRVIPSMCVASWDSEVSILIVGIAYIQFAIVLWCYVAIFVGIKKLVKRQKAMAMSQEITYESPSLNRRNCASPSLSLSPSLETSSTSLELPPQANQPDGPVNLRIKAALNRSFSNYEGSQSECFGLSRTEMSRSIKGSLSSLGFPEACLEVMERNETKGIKRCSTSPSNIADGRRSSHRNLQQGSDCLDSNIRHTTNSLSPNIHRHLNSIRDRFNESFMRRKHQTSVKRQWKENEHFAKVMGAIVLLFYISWLPLAVSITMTLIIGMTPLVLQITYVSLLMTLGGPLLIPIVYGVMAKAYRSAYSRAVKSIFCCCCGKNGRFWSRRIHVNEN